MRMILLVPALLLLACGRPLTPQEAAFATRLHGDTLDIARIRLHAGAPVGAVSFDRPPRPRLTCRERLLPEPRGTRVTVSPAAVVVFNRVFFAHDWYAADFLPGYPDRISLTHAMLFAHEMTHVWQWQNRALTGYSPLRAAREHRVSADPYLFEVTTGARLLDYGFEQQASIVEEYVCCATLDPAAPRTAHLRAMLAAAVPLEPLSPPAEVTLPWDGAETEGICGA